MQAFSICSKHFRRRATSDPISRGAATRSVAVYRRRARANCGVCVRIESLPLLSRCPQRDGGAPGHQARTGGQPDRYRWSCHRSEDAASAALRSQAHAAAEQSDTSGRDAIFAAGWEEPALYYTVAVTALFNFMNRLVEGMGIELDSSYVKPASERLAKRGYLPLIDMISH